MGASVTEDELRELIAEVDINQNATIEEEEFLQVCVCVCVGARAFLHLYVQESLYSWMNQCTVCTCVCLDDECPKDR